VNDTAPGIDHGTVLSRDQALPGVPAAPLAQRQLDRVAEAGPDDGVRVEKEEQLAGGLGRTAIAGGTEAGVLGRLVQLRARRQLADQPPGIVARGVVGDDQLIVVAKLCRDRRQGSADLCGGVVGDDDDRELDRLRGGLAQKTR
jgi:hypothetical protein